MLKPIGVDEFNKRIQERFPEEHFTVLDYKGLGHPLVIQCDDCKKIISVSKACNFLGKNKVVGCKYCKSIHIKSREQILQLIKERYEILDVFQQNKNEHYRYKLKCKRCGHIREGFLRNIQNHMECGCITNNIKRTTEEFKRDLFKRKGDDYTLLSEFSGMHDKVLIKHESCGFIWKVRPADILYERSCDCPHCRKPSKQERLVSSLLTEMNIPYIREEQLKNSLQRFDFYIEYSNKFFAIECNGRQHYQYIDFLHHGDVKVFEKRKELDAIKRQYCLANNIFLLEIPYTITNKDLVQELIIAFLQGSTTKVEEILEKNAPTVG